MNLQATTWQTVGPYFRLGLEHLETGRIAPPDTAGEHISVEGRVLDGNGKPVPDAVIEIWQANGNGEYNAVNGNAGGFRGFGRIPTDTNGRFAFTTIKPGPVPGPRGTMQSSHLAVRVMMRGLLRDLVTRIYFAGDDLADDPVLQLVPEARRATLIAAPATPSVTTFIWNIELQGERETVFFDC
jgi:protocatechuate 3,4-dioxygenase, alpha subunit